MPQPIPSFSGHGRAAALGADLLPLAGGRTGAEAIAHTQAEPIPFAQPHAEADRDPHPHAQPHTHPHAQPGPLTKPLAQSQPFAFACRFRRGNQRPPYGRGRA